jgi:hypothetical protein
VEGGGEEVDADSRPGRQADRVKPLDFVVNII